MGAHTDVYVSEILCLYTSLCLCTSLYVHAPSTHIPPSVFASKHVCMCATFLCITASLLLCAAPFFICVYSGCSFVFVCEGERVRDREQPVVVMEGAERLMGVVLRAIVSLHSLSGHIVYAWGHICSGHRHSLHTPRDTVRLYVCARMPVCGI